jgi:hypothetical protein
VSAIEIAAFAAGVIVALNDSPIKIAHQEEANTIRFFMTNPFSVGLCAAARGHLTPLGKALLPHPTNAVLNGSNALAAE